MLENEFDDDFADEDNMHDEYDDLDLKRYSRGYFPPSKPRKTKGGIKAQSKRGSFAETWWGKRWSEIVEHSHIGARLGRGKNYARQGQVISIDIDKGRINAKVQGSRKRPYHVNIQVQEIGKKDWDNVITQLGDQPLFTAKLLAGEMPDELEYVFHEALVSLFPSLEYDIKNSCTCPDWSNPCKHIAAIYFLLSEEFDRDPFLIFKLRGMDRDELLSRLAPTSSANKQNQVVEREVEEEMNEPLPVDETLFWHGEVLPPDFPPAVEPPQVNAVLPKRLGHFPFWRGNMPFLQTLDDLYRQVSTSNLHLMLDDGLE